MNFITKLLQRFMCWIGRHHLFVVRNLNIGGQLYECPECGQQFAIHHGRQICLEYWRVKDEDELMGRLIAEAKAKQ